MTACSAWKSRVCCTPQPVKGSSRFLLHSPSAARRRPWKPLAFPATRFTPFEEFPSSAAVPHHCGRCHLAVTTATPALFGRNRSERRPFPGRSRKAGIRVRPDLRRGQAPDPGELGRPTSEEVGFARSPLRLPLPTPKGLRGWSR
jgi:hypothetical protein